MKQYYIFIRMAKIKVTAPNADNDIEKLDQS